MSTATTELASVRYLIDDVPAAVERIYELGGLTPVIAQKLAEEGIVPGSVSPQRQ